MKTLPALAAIWIALALSAQAQARDARYSRERSGRSERDARPGAARDGEIGPNSSQKDSAAAPSWERYQILVQRNIFSKERGRAQEERRERTREPEKEAAPVAVPPGPKPEADIQLIGILQKDGELVAFLENNKTGAVQAIRQGGAIARGTISTITLDSIDYSYDGSVSTVSIGKNLEGGVAVQSADAAKKEAGENSILERMRKKRLEDLRK